MKIIWSLFNFLTHPIAQWKRTVQYFCLTQFKSHCQQVLKTHLTLMKGIILAHLVAIQIWTYKKSCHIYLYIYILHYYIKSIFSKSKYLVIKKLPHLFKILTNFSPNRPIVLLIQGWPCSKVHLLSLPKIYIAQYIFLPLMTF